jgi:hypothetical protein
MRTHPSHGLPCLLAVAVLALATAPAVAAQTALPRAVALDLAAEAPSTWTDFLRTDDLAVRLDTARVERRDDGALLVWVRFEYADDEPVPGRPGERYARMEIREALDCDRQRVADVELTILDRAERVLGTTRAEAPRWRTFVDHPFDTDLFILACRLLSPRAAAG